MNLTSVSRCGDYMNKFYFGSIVWKNRVISIYTNRHTIPFNSVQDNLDGTSFVSNGSIETGVKTFLKEAKYERILTQHTMAEETAKRLGVKSLCLLCDDQGIEAYTHRGIKTEKRDKSESRKAFIPMELRSRNKLYTGVEIKGCGSEGGPINLNKFRMIGNTNIDNCVEGGVYLDELEQEAKFMKDSPLLLSAYELPIEVTSECYGKKKLGLLVRAVECSFRLSQMNNIKEDILHVLNTTEKEYNGIICKNLSKQVRRMLKSGYYHPAPTEENVDGLGNLTDLVLMPVKSEKDIEFNLMNYNRILRSLGGAPLSV